MRVGDIITDGSVKWVVRHIDHPKAGVIVDWQSTTSMGDGFLKCTGASVDPNVYPLLKNILPLVGGKLILPDRRGVVPRGLDDGRGLDVGRVLGSFQEDAIRNITGSIDSRGLQYGGNPQGTYYTTFGTLTGAFNSISVAYNDYYLQSTSIIHEQRYNKITANFNAGNIVPIAAENRMKNVATTFWICYA